MLSKITLNSPWYLFLLCFLLSLLAAYWLYARLQSKDVHRRVKFSLVTLRFLSLMLVSVLLLGIFLKYYKNQTENPLILLAIDNSRSMVSGNDSAYVNSAFLKELEKLRENTGKKYDVKTLLFGSSTSAASLPDFKEKETDISQLFSDIENNYSNQNIGALVIASDGIYNKGSNPLYAAEKLNYPIYTIALGDTTENKDALIQKVDHNQVAYLGNNFPVEVLVHVKKFQGREVSVGLWQNGVLKEKRGLKVNSDNFLSAYQFTLNAEKTGVVRYEAKIGILEGEKNISNNTQAFVIEVIDNKEKILLLANAPHPDISAIKEAVSARSNYELDDGLLNEFKGSLKPYSLVILHGFSGGSIVNDCKQNAIPFLIVNPQVTEGLPGVKINSSFSRFNDTEPVVNNSFGLFGLSAELKKFVRDLPALKTFFGNYVPLNSANILLNQRVGDVETENPILLFTEMNDLKCGVFIGDGLWRWKLRDFAEHKNNDLFNELITKSIQYLAVKNDKSLFRISSKKIISENEAFEMEAEVYNKSYEPITEPDVNLTLINSDKKKFNYTFGKTASSYKLNVGLLPAGDYRYEALVKSGSEIFAKQGSVSVKEVIAEKINTVADHRLLSELSRASQGKLFYPAQLELLEQELIKNEAIKPVTYSQNSNLPLIDLKWLFFILLLIFAAEWTLRKRYLHI